ncbi:MAG: hypothetical protein LLF94_05220 [Chlamydiales bacterium]|nr:hypothetical protein [Chlamydiales bacterium]
MVKIEHQEKIEYNVDAFEEKGYIEVTSSGRTYRLKVVDDGGAGHALTKDAVTSIVSDLIDNKSLSFGRSLLSKKITIDKENCRTLNLHSSLVFKVTTSSTTLRSLVNFFRKMIVEPLFGKKTTLTKHITVEFRKQVEKLPEKIKQKILNDLRITHSEHYALKYFGDIINDHPEEEKLAFVQEALNGAYVQIEDNGEFYNKWLQEVPHKVQRTSSHASSATQFSFQGPLFKECLFSKKKVKNEDGTFREVTWFQLERYPLGKAYVIPHLLTWALYKITGKNQGPHGASAHTEHNNPIILKP